MGLIRKTKTHEKQCVKVPPMFMHLGGSMILVKSPSNDRTLAGDYIGSASLMNVATLVCVNITGHWLIIIVPKIPLHLWFHLYKKKAEQSCFARESHVSGGMRGEKKTNIRMVRNTHQKEHVETLWH